MNTILKIENKDGTTRVIRPIGNYTYESAIKLARDLEKENYKSVTIQK